jgi:hypothetical protein
MATPPVRRPALGARLFIIIRGPEEIDLQRDDFPPDEIFMARWRTREWIEDELIPRFIRELERKHGSLEAAVAAGHARGLKRWVRWRFNDRLRKQYRESGGDELGPEELQAQERALWGPIDVWARAKAANLPERDRDMLELYREGHSHKGIGDILGGPGEAAVRKRLVKLHTRLGLPRRRRWQRRLPPESRD